jgi:hypothetical protein
MGTAAQSVEAPPPPIMIRPPAPVVKLVDAPDSKGRRAHGTNPWSQFRPARARGRGGTGRRAALKMPFPKGVSVRFRPPAPKTGSGQKVIPTALSPAGARPCGGTGRHAIQNRVPKGMGVRFSPRAHYQRPTTQRAYPNESPSFTIVYPRTPYPARRFVAMRASTGTVSST